MPLLRTVDLRVAYGSRVALGGVSLDVDAGAALAVAGPNGAGKTSLLRAVSGLLDAHGGRVTAGRVELAVGATVAHVLEGRRVFRDLTVAENLRVGGFRLRGRRLVRDRVEAALARLPVLAARRDVRAGLLSGGEQQLLVIARALVSSPDLLLLDEPAVGLARDAIVLVAAVVNELRASGTGVLVAEQEPRLALALGASPVPIDGGRLQRRVPAGA